MMYFFWPWMIMIWIVIVGLIVWGTLALVRRGSSSSSISSRNPLDIAKERYAKGEITREEFEEIKKNLSG